MVLRFVVNIVGLLVFVILLGCIVDLEGKFFRFSFFVILRKLLEFICF